MALPPWTVELLRRGVADLARQATDPETTAALKEQATKLVDELPKAARAKVDTLLKQAGNSTKPLRDAWTSSEIWQNFAHGVRTNSESPNRLINASGCLFNPRGTGIALPPEVLSAAIPFLAGDGSVSPDARQTFQQQIAEVVASQTQSEEELSAFVTSSFDSAIACIGALSGRQFGRFEETDRQSSGRPERPARERYSGNPRGTIWVPRCCAVAIDPMATSRNANEDDDADSTGDERLLVNLLRRLAGGPVREFGSADGTGELPRVTSSVSNKGSDGDHKRTSRQNVLVRLASKPLENLFKHANRQEWIEVVVMPMGSVLSPPDDLSMIDSAIKHLRKGADVVVIVGGVLSAMPEVGLVLGKGFAVDNIENSARHRNFAAPVALTAMVAASVRSQGMGDSTVWQLAKVSEENLRDRAERLATQLGDCDWVESTFVTDQPAVVGIADSPSVGPDQASDPHRLASRQVVLRVKPPHQAASIAKRLADGSTGLLTRTIDDGLAIDLRWVTPQQQSQINDLVKAVL